MDSINWVQLMAAMVLAIVIAGGFMVLGMWLDKRRDVRWNRELHEDRPPLPVRISKQRENEDDQRGA